ncbi:hypothetical protein, partial [Citrobacter freundii]|uniref:hypothetical protein n=1 Tax=Citrobacter freundii TaxID=546 RepID=UPI002FE5E0BB
MIKLKLSCFPLSKTANNYLLQLIDYQNFDFSFGEEFSPRIQVIHASTFNTLPLLANLDDKAVTAV